MDRLVFAVMVIAVMMWLFWLISVIEDVGYKKELEKRKQERTEKLLALDALTKRESELLLAIREVLKRENGD